MADFMTPEQRHNNMSRIRGSGTSPEVYIRKLLFSNGYRYRIQSKGIPGKPDIWMHKYNTAIFINGCFWHRHENCKFSYMPKSRVEFWQEKFTKNIERDKEVKRRLQESNHKCLIVWECTIRKMRKNQDVADEIFNKITGFLSNDVQYLEI